MGLGPLVGGDAHRLGRGSGTHRWTCSAGAPTGDEYETAHGSADGDRPDGLGPALAHSHPYPFALIRYITIRPTRRGLDPTAGSAGQSGVGCRVVERASRPSAGPSVHRRSVEECIPVAVDAAVGRVQGGEPDGGRCDGDDSRRCCSPNEQRKSATPHACPFLPKFDGTGPSALLSTLDSEALNAIDSRHSLLCHPMFAVRRDPKTGGGTLGSTPAWRSRSAPFTRGRRVCSRTRGASMRGKSPASDGGGLDSVDELRLGAGL